MLTKEKLRDTLLTKDNGYRTDLQLVFNTYTNQTVEYLTDKLEETVHRTNQKLCRYFLKRPETRIHFVGFIEEAFNNTHCHCLLKIPSMYDENEVIKLLAKYFRQLDTREIPKHTVYRGKKRSDLAFYNVSYTSKGYRCGDDRFIYL